MPDIFPDLNLDQVVDAIVAGREEYDLAPIFYKPLGSVAAINYRHEVFKDLQASSDFMKSFATGMRQMRRSLALREKLYYERQKQRAFLDAVELYCEAVASLSRDLHQVPIESQGLRHFREWLTYYCNSEAFTGTRDEAHGIITDLKSITYNLHIRGRRATVSKYASEPDYGADVLNTFAKFSQGSTKAYSFQRRSSDEMNHVEAAILDLVAELYPEIFARLEAFCNQHASYLSETLVRFDREAQFYLAYLDHLRQFQNVSISFCYPEVCDRSKEIYGRNVFDLALARKLSTGRSPIVTNDFLMKGSERIFIVTGPNQGGKTTFGRTMGQLHYLASVGCPVPGSEAKLFLFDRIFTHFERSESVRTLKGRLEDELIRIKQILDCATPNSILIMNESFLSTTVTDAVFLSRQILERIVELDLICVSITFLDELATLTDTTVSMVSAVDPNNPTLRTFKLIRKSADGLAYANAIAEKYHLTSETISTRISHNAQRRRSQ